ncbi:hypothetical protein BDR06DRAFT_287819 [Suillus hirtellus]|nr:hypothetical protein BDR06DRAFT_287819 [Suillus hirtellus]
MFLVNRASLLYMYCILLFGSYSKGRSNSYIDILLSQPNLEDQFLPKIKTRHISKRDRNKLAYQTGRPFLNLGRKREVSVLGVPTFPTRPSYHGLYTLPFNLSVSDCLYLSGSIINAQTRSIVILPHIRVFKHWPDSESGCLSSAPRSQEATSADVTTRGNFQTDARKHHASHPSHADAIFFPSRTMIIVSLSRTSTVPTSQRFAFLPCRKSSVQDSRDQPPRDH